MFKNQHQGEILPVKWSSFKKSWKTFFKRIFFFKPFSYMLTSRLLTIFHLFQWLKVFLHVRQRK